MLLLPSKSRSFLAGIFCIVLCLGVAIFVAKREEKHFGFDTEISFLEEWFDAGQGKAVSLWGLHEPLFQRQDSLTIGKLISLTADPEVWGAAEIRDMSRYILHKSEEYEVSPYLVLSLIEVESGFRPNAVSSRGAMGLMQIMPTTAEAVALGAGMRWRGSFQLEDPKVNIDLGLRYMTTLKNQFRRPEHALIAYNIGPGALERKLKSGERLPQEYYQRVMERMRYYKRESKEALSTRDRRKKTWL